MCLTEIMDSVHRALNRKRWCYLASFDIAGAFDNVSHRQLMTGLKRFGVDIHSRRVIHNWLGSRTFRVRLATSLGYSMSKSHPITKGLPQGGALSPILWIAFFDPLIAGIKAERELHPLEEVEHTDLLYADDYTLLITADSREEACKAAHINVSILKKKCLRR